MKLSRPGPRHGLGLCRQERWERHQTLCNATSGPAGPNSELFFFKKKYPITVHCLHLPKESTQESLLPFPPRLFTFWLLMIKGGLSSLYQPISFFFTSTNFSCTWALTAGSSTKASMPCLQPNLPSLGLLDLQHVNLVSTLPTTVWWCDWQRKLSKPGPHHGFGSSTLKGVDTTTTYAPPEKARFSASRTYSRFTATKLFSKAS